MNLFDVYPINEITIVKAKGSYVWDDKGEQYLDLYGGHAVISIFHNRIVRYRQYRLHHIYRKGRGSFSESSLLLH